MYFFNCISIFPRWHGTTRRSTTPSIGGCPHGYLFLQQLIPTCLILILSYARSLIRFARQANHKLKGSGAGNAPAPGTIFIIPALLNLYAASAHYKPNWRDWHGPWRNFCCDVSGTKLCHTDLVVEVRASREDVESFYASKVWLSWEGLLGRHCAAMMRTHCTHARVLACTLPRRLFVRV